MKKILSLFLFTALICCLNTNAQIAAWNPAGLSGYGPSPFAATTTAANVTVVGLTRGSGVSLGGTAAGNAWGGTDWQGASEAAGISIGDSITFRITANSGFMVSLSSFQLFYRRSGTGASNGKLQYSLDGGTSYTDISTLSYSSSSSSGSSLPSVSLSGIAALQNVPCGTTIRFRIINWGGTGSSGTWYVFSSGLSVSGTVTSYPAPAVVSSPVSVSIPSGSGTAFSVSGVSDAATYQWQRNTSGLVGGTWVNISSATLDPTGTYAGFTTTSSATSNTLTLSGVPASWDGYGYRCVVTNCSGSTTSTGALLNVSSGTCSGMPAAGTAVPGVASFCGSGSTTLTLSGGTSGGGISYQWSSSATATPPGTDIPGATSSTYTTPSLTSTTYYWCTTSCSASTMSNLSAMGTVTINPIPVVAAPGGNVCSGGSGLSITATGASTYIWTPATGLSATTGATVTANPVINTTYTITGTSAAGCSASTTATVNYNLNPSALSITPSSLSACQGGAAQLLTANGGLIGPTTVNSGTITIPGSIAAFGTISNAITMAGVPAGAVITGASVNIINFGSQYQDDYVINIKAPNNNVLNLINQRGTHTSTVTTLFSNTNLSSASSVSLATGSGTYTGTWRADAVTSVGVAPFVSNTNLWSDLFSIPNGTWAMSIFNNTGFTNIVMPSAQWSITLIYAYQAAVTWSPTTDLYTDAAATIAYTGTPSTSVYFNPAAVATGSYTATADNASCISTANVTTTVNPSPATITGIMNVCETATTSLSTTTTGGTWSSSHANASVDASSGVVTGVTSGTATISYILPSGCYATTTVTVFATPAPITGTAVVCEGANTTLTNTISGGTWSSSNTNATIDAASGIVSGNTAGTSNITYSLAGGCVTSTTFTVNTTPAAISGSMNVCETATTTLSSTTTSGTWSTSNSNASIGASSGILTGVTAGTSVVSYILPTGCFTVNIVTVNASPAAITGTAVVCESATTLFSNTIAGGTWSSSNANATIVPTTGVATGNTAGTSIITYSLTTGCMASVILTVNPSPGAITGTLSVCEAAFTTLGNPVSGGTWSSTNTNATVGLLSGIVGGVTAGTTNISYILPGGCNTSEIVTVNQLPSLVTGVNAICQGSTTTYASATTGGNWSTGNANASIIATTGFLTGITEGSSIVSYTLPTGCYATKAITVNVTPTTISGSDQVCEGSTTALGNTVTGGSWTSSSASASIAPFTGLVTGVSSGTAGITYTLSTGCFNSKTITVNSLPAPVAGSLGVCIGYTTTLNSSTAGGTWSTSNANTSAGSLTGVITGVAVGTSRITYTLPTGCIATALATVNSLPAPITGTMQICLGTTSTLSNTSTGGTWNSSNLSRATVNTITGLVSAVSVGTANISYTLGTGCIVTATVTLNPNPPSITGTTQFCAGTSVTVSNSLSGGTWSSSNSAIATINAAGLVNGITSGSAQITYTIPTGCIRTIVVSINPAPAPFAGTYTVCRGRLHVLSSATPGGVWISSNTAVAPVSYLSGVVTGAAVGTASITYTLPTGCFTSGVMTVNTTPSPVSGNLNACLGSTTTLGNTVSGGVWSSSNMSVAIIDPSGLVSAITLGTTIISYTLPTGCYSSDSVRVNPLPLVYPVTGGGSYCAGSPGVNIGIGTTETGTRYRLINSGTTISTITGIGGAMGFGAIPMPGIYTVIAENILSGCQSNMTGVATVSINPLVMPAVSISFVTGDTTCSGNTL
ncbi:MAG: Ig-like domain-containing protein, partial [Taibaiella sp.]|nr:Ig-like domain-containing protein [Taibaiella sp.]